jgi:hypothetical protein
MDNNVARMGDMKDVYRVLVGRPVGWNRLEDLGVDGRIILKWGMRAWSGLIWTRIGTCGGLL